jgi:hypothetical protein
MRLSDLAHAVLDRHRTPEPPKLTPVIALHTLEGPQLTDCGDCGGRAISWHVVAELEGVACSSPTRLSACGCGWKEAL